MHIQLGLFIYLFKSQDITENCSFWIFNHIRVCKEIIGGEKQKNKSPENVRDLKQAINIQSWTSLKLSNEKNIVNLGNV